MTIRLATAACVLLFAVAARAATVGDPAHPGDLGAALRRAYAGGDHRLRIAPGTCYMPAGANGDAVLLDGWRNAYIFGTGVTLVFADYNHRAVHLRNCEKVAITGATLRFAVPAYTQGRVAATGTDAAGPWVDWQIDRGYPTDPARLEETYNLVDAATRLIKAGTGDIGTTSRTGICPGRFRLRFRDAVPPLTTVGDWLVCRHRAGTTLVHFDRCDCCTAHRITCENGGFATFFDTDGPGGNRLFGCVIRPGPTPVGGAERQLVGCGADGFHCVNDRVGPVVLNCMFTGVFLDDGIAIHGTFGAVAAASTGTTVTFTDMGDGGATVGDPMRFSDTRGFFAEATVMAIDKNADGTRVTLDRPLNIPAMAKGNNPARCGRGYLITATRLGDNRSRGILVKADDGDIDNCTISGCVMSGVSLGPEYYWNEANYVRRTTIRRCRFVGAGSSTATRAGRIKRPSGSTATGPSATPTCGWSIASSTPARCRP